MMASSYMPSFDLGLGFGSPAPPLPACNGEDLETMLHRKYSENTISNVDLDHIFASLEVVETESIAALDQSEGARISEGPPTADEGKAAFLPRDAAFQQALDAGGINPSISVDKWALNRLRKFQNFIGADVSSELVDMDPLAASVLLCEFFERARKENGELYPPPSLMSLLRAFNRVFCKAQEARVLRTAVDEPVFRMKQSPLFRRVCVACVLAMTRSKDAGLGVKRKKSSVVSLEAEKCVLQTSFMAKTHSRGLLRRTAHYALFRFGIRGGSELRALKAIDFSIGNDDSGRYVQYNERLSKNYKITLERFQTEHFRPAVKSYEEDVVDTFDSYLRRRPDRMNEMFLAPIDNPRSEIWYLRLVVGARMLSTIVKQSFKEAGLPDDASCSSVSNKSGRATLITRMSESGVPPKVGMLISGHKSESAYGRYDQSSEARVRAAQLCVQGNVGYGNALEKENLHVKNILIEGKMSKEPEKKTKIECGFVSDNGQNYGGRIVLPLPEPEPMAEVEEWAANYDWGGDARGYFKGKGQVINNPVSALFGNLTNCSLNVTFAGPVNFAGQGQP